MVWESSTLKNFENQIDKSQIIDPKNRPLIVKNFLNPELCKKISNRILQIRKGNKEREKIGISLVSHSANKEQYFEKSEKARPLLREIFKGLEDPRKKIHKFLSSLYHDYNILIAEEDGKRYACGIIRIHDQGKSLHLHRDCVSFEAPNFYVAKNSGQLSCVLYLQTPAKGGGLKIYKKSWTRQDEKYREIEFGYSKKALKDCQESVVITPKPGDLVVFNPLFYHEILPVEASSERISLNLFAAFGFSGKKILTWS